MNAAMIIYAVVSRHDVLSLWESREAAQRDALERNLAAGWTEDACWMPAIEVIDIRMNGPIWQLWYEQVDERWKAFCAGLDLKPSA